MKNIHFGDGEITTLILIKKDALAKKELFNYYVKPLEDKGLSRDNIAVFSLLYENSNIKAELGKNYLRMLLPKINKLKTVENLIVADSNYFKWLTKQTKVTNSYGEIFSGKLGG